MSATTVTVELGERSYRVEIDWGGLGKTGARVAAVVDSSRGVVVTDANVGPLHGRTVVASLREAGIDAHLVTVPPGESSKSLEQAGKLYDDLLSLGMERGSPVVALGGGVVGDLAGFVAATFMRGVPLVMVPTSLLACVDSSVGGKVAVDLPRAKNIVGAFYQPRLVVIDPEVLRTLPTRELAAGMAEVIKYGVIMDEEFFRYLEAKLPAAMKLTPDVLEHVIARCCRLKADVVSKDETESGLRMMLNYGHTVAHAVETVTGYGRYLHGEAVAIGMQCAAMVAADLGMVPLALVERQRKLLAAAGLPTGLGELEPARLMEAMKRDKKVRHGRVRFVLPVRLGEVLVRDDVTDEVVSRVLEKCSRS